MKQTMEDIWLLLKVKNKRIRELEKENEELHAALNRATKLMVDGVVTHERMMLKLIVNGNLSGSTPTT